MHILQKIVQRKRIELEATKKLISQKTLEMSPFFERTPLSMSENIKSKFGGIIAEFKRQSPSKPSINPFATVDQVLPKYAKAGAAASSILTNFHFFKGNVLDIVEARGLVDIPLLRKEFIIDEFQILEAKSIGADAILLISEILDKKTIARFAALAHSLGLEVLLEMHSEDHLSKLSNNIQMVGINNRNLKTFEVDFNHSIRIFKQLPDTLTRISESGISNTSTILQLKELGYDGFLIGERFMAHENPGEQCQSFIQELKAKS